MKKNFEIWATFKDGLIVKVETHKTERSAKAAIDAMIISNQHDIKEGYGFPHGVPSYEIRCSE